MSVKWVGSSYDTGKVTDYETEGSYAETGAESVIKHKENDAATNSTVLYYGDIEVILATVAPAVVVDVSLVVRLGVCSEMSENHTCCPEKPEETLELHDGAEKLHVT